jgi:hypothetical protein
MVSAIEKIIYAGDSIFCNTTKIVSGLEAIVLVPETMDFISNKIVSITVTIVSVSMTIVEANSQALEK